MTPPARRLLFVAAALGLLLAARLPETPSPFPAEARSGSYTVDAVHSSAWFGVQHLGVSNFYGRFNDVDGEFVLDTADPGACSVRLAIRADSVDTANAKRDAHVRSEDFLDAGKFPAMSFESDAVKAGADGALRVSGTLNLHGESHELSFDARVIGSADSPFGDHRCGVEARFTVKRSDYGMDGMLAMLGDEVSFVVSLEGVLQQD